MSSPRQAKRCPQCGTMTQTETSVCQTCGHLFRSDTDIPQPSFNPERTQMLTLPPSLSQPAPPQMMPHEPITYIEPVAPSRHAKTPFVSILIIVTLLLIAMFYWLLR